MSHASFGHSYNKELCIGFQKSQFNWALYISFGNPLQSRQIFFNCIGHPYGLFVNWAEGEGARGATRVLVGIFITHIHSELLKETRV